MDSVAIIRDVHEAGCLDTLHEVFEIEKRLLSTLSIEETFKYYSLRSRLGCAWLAPFYFCTERERVCATFAETPRLCCDMECRLHSMCLICQCPSHGTLEVYDGECITRCEHVHRVCEELDMMASRWNIDVATIWHYFSEQ